MKELPTHADQRYIDGMMKNDRNTVNEIYTSFFDRIKNYIKKNNGTELDAQDIFQDAIMAIFEKTLMKPVRLTCPFEAFLLRICRNLWLNKLKKNQKIVTMDDSDVSLNIPDDSAHLADEIEQSIYWKKALEQNLQKISDKCRQILTRYYAGETLKEIAESMGKNHSLIRRNKGECIEKLRAHF